MLGEIRAFILPKKQEVRIQMASRIKGITVEIGGDTTKLTDALTVPQCAKTVLMFAQTERMLL